MKRLAMAATFALALSLGGWSPAAAQADSDTVPQSADLHAAGDAGDGAADAPETENPAPEDPGDGEDATDPGGGGESTDPDEGDHGSDAGEGEDSADPNDGEGSADPDDGADGGGEDSTPIDASFSLDQKTMPVDEAAEAIPYTITGLTAGDRVTASPGEDGPITVDSDGTFNGSLRGNSEVKVGDVLSVTVTVDRDGQESKTFTGSVTITAADDDSDGDLSVDPKTQGLDTFQKNGVGITLSNCVMDEEVTFTVTREGEDTPIWEDTQFAAGEDAAGFTTFIPDAGGDELVGDYAVSASCGDTTEETTFSVTADDAADADLTVTPKTQSLRDFLDSGVTITLVNCHVDSDVTFRVSTKHDPDTEIWSETQKAGEDAAGSVRFTPEEGGGGWATEFLVMATCGDKSAETTFTVTDDGSAIDPKLSITPERISGTDFIDRDKGVELTVTECAPDTDVQFEVYSAGMEDKLYEQTAAADEEGTAGIQVYGLGDDPAHYVGTYNVRATCVDTSRDGQFVVTGSETGGGGSGDSDNAGGGASMPRTGAELTGLVAGSLLILGGGAAIALARRRSLN